MSVFIHEYSEGQQLGGKANRLLELQTIGVRIPPFFVIPHEVLHRMANEDFLSYEDEKEDSHFLFAAWFITALEESVGILGFPLAVRSSANMEDGISHSFAGQFESLMNVNSMQGLLDAIMHCWKSNTSNRVVEYAQKQGLDGHKIQVNVIVQKQVRSLYSGVLFTVNHQTGEGREMMLEAVRGQGEALVQGQVTPELIRYNWFEESVVCIGASTQDRYLDFADNGEGLIWKTMQRTERILDDHEVKALCEQALHLQMHYGYPLDIEWAKDESGFYILQARPLTSLHFETNLDWTNADLKDGGISASIATPMMYSLYEMVFEKTMPQFFGSIGILGKKTYDKWFTEWMGYSYWNVQAVKEGAKKIPGFVERNFDKSMGIASNYEGEGHKTGFTLKSIINGLNILWKTKQSIESRPEAAKATIERAQVFYYLAEEFLENKIIPAHLPSFLKQIRKEYLDIEGNYFLAIYDNSNAATFAQEQMEAVSKNKNGPRYLDMIIGLKDVSHLRPAIAMWRLSRDIRKDAEAKKFYADISANELLAATRKGTAFPFKTQWKEYIEQFKFKSRRELDLLSPRWQSDYGPALEMLQGFLEKTDEESPETQVDLQHQKFSNEFQKLRKQKLRQTVRQHRNLLWWREELREHSTKTYFYIRKILLKIAAHFVATGALKEQSDIFFLKMDQLIAFVESADTSGFQQFIEKNKKYHRSFRNFQKPNEIYRQQTALSSAKKADDGDLFHGIAGAPGIVRGKARVLKNIDEADQIFSGEILVTPSTDPGWTTYFTRIAGLVTETGGMLSHGAVVSREFGLPAVMAVPDICSLLKTGDVVSVNGFNGTVSRMLDD